MILITTDGSQRSTRVIPHAAALARICEEQVTLLRVFDPGELASEPNTTRPARLRQEVASLEDGMSRLIAEASVSGAPHAEPLLKGESVPRAILRFAAETDASLITMDSRGARRHSPCTARERRNGNSRALSPPSDGNRLRNRSR